MYIETFQYNKMNKMNISLAFISCNRSKIKLMVVNYLLKTIDQLIDIYLVFD